MSVIKTINESEFVKEFTDMNRETNFSVAGREKLFEYFDEQENDVKIDVIAICCDWTESTTSDLINDYSLLDEKLNDGTDSTKEEIEETIQEWLDDRTTNYKIEVDGETHWLYCNF